jgi:hypothetical protein
VKIAELRTTDRMPTPHRTSTTISCLTIRFGRKRTNQYQKVTRENSRNIQLDSLERTKHRQVISENGPASNHLAVVLRSLCFRDMHEQKREYSTQDSANLRSPERRSRDKELIEPSKKETTRSLRVLISTVFVIVQYCSKKHRALTPFSYFLPVIGNREAILSMQIICVRRN